MGGRVSCSCPEAYCYGSDEHRLRIHAELFELSSDGQKWLMVEPRLLYVTLSAGPDGHSVVRATTQLGRTVLESTIPRGDKVEKISDCFVFWREGSRTFGVNTLSARDAEEFRRHLTSPIEETHQMIQQNTMAQVCLVASWDGKTLQKRPPHPETTMVSLNPLSLVFHFNHGLLHVDLLECYASTCDRPNVLFLSYAANIYEFEFSSSAEKFLTQVLNMSSLLLARTTCSDVAVSYLMRQRTKARERIALLKYHQESAGCLTFEKLCLKEKAIEQRLAALGHGISPTMESFPPSFGSSVRDQLLDECQLPSLYLLFAKMHAFRMWRKPVDIRVNDLRALVSPGDVTMTSSANMTSSTPSTSTDTVIPIILPNGKTTVISHSNQDPQQLKDKVCSKLCVQSSLFSLSKSPEGAWILTLSEEYQVEKTQGRLGLTIYAHNDGGRIKAEVRGVASFSPGGAAIGDSVIAVDGILIEQVQSAADVEKLLRDGRIIRLRRNTVRKEKTAGNGQRAETQRKEGRETAESDGQKTAGQKAETQREKSQPPPPIRRSVPPSIPQMTSSLIPMTSSTNSTNSNSNLEVSRAKMDERMIRGIEELVRTEKKYVEDLAQMIDRFLSIRIVCDIMESALRLQKVQMSFLEALEEAVGDVIDSGGSEQTTTPQIRDSVMRVSALFVNRCGELKVYAEYAAGYLRLQREIQVNKQLMTSLEAANSSGEQHCSYESRMIRPVQRVVQYPLMLRAILAGCQADSMEARQVEAALQKMQTLAEYVNEMQRIHEQFAPLIEVVRKNNIQMIVEKGLRIDIRDLLIFAHIRWINAERGASDYVIFVFQSIILLLPANIRTECKPKWTRAVPINEVEVDEGEKEAPALCLVHVAFKGADGKLSHGNPDTVYQLSCCQTILKQQLVKSIRKARTNFVRETRRPLSGSSQSDGGYGSDPAKERKNS